jgi:glycosyltransferase involved in cell wall biosynthesis
MSDRPLISVIIPAYNAEKTIKTAVLSVLNQTYQPVELIVVDGASKDNTLQVLSELQQVKSFKVISEKDKGVYDAMNKGITSATGEWLYFLGADDELYNNDVLQKVFGSVVPAADMIYGNIWLTEQKKVYGGPFGRWKILMKNVSHQAIFYKRQLFEIFGTYDLSYPILADYVFNLKLFAQPELKLQYIDLTIANFAEEGLSSTRRDQNFKRDRANLVKAHYPLPHYLFAAFGVPLIDILEKKLSLKK